MDTRSGEIVPKELVDQLPEEERRFFIPMELPPTLAQRRGGRVGRNDPCPCGSGKLFKNCHWVGDGGNGRPDEEFAALADIKKKAKPLAKALRDLVHALKGDGPREIEDAYRAVCRLVGADQEESP